jgi:hypothetical protein
MSYDDFATYDDVYGPGGMADDRDDTFDPEFRADDGYCEHGTYVGGCGADLMCSWCEDGISLAEAIKIETARKTRAVRERSENQQLMIARLLMLREVSGTDVLRIVEYDNRYLGNPRSRYGRH